MMVYGPYGSGKTQTLFHLEWYLYNKRDQLKSFKLTPHTLHLDIEVQSKSDCGAIHLQIMETLGKETVSQWVSNLFGQVPDLAASLRELSSGDPNIAATLQELRAGGPTSLLAWRWLFGDQL
jgi:hypothetical protein